MFDDEEDGGGGDYCTVADHLRFLFTGKIIECSVCFVEWLITKLKQIIVKKY